ncbi:MAG: glycosyltransferase family 2 protein [Candidatus Omnitrophica bacterium]|nr:glycosyltransferase family 2 protein [Candidatus Omnitrophota bacterium]
MIKQKKISIIFSFRNEEKTLEELYRRTQDVLKRSNLLYEMIFVNDASTDGSLNILTNLALKDQSVKVINLSRRFGYNQSFMAGLEFFSGDAAVILDSDLQDSPEEIPRLIEKWELGAEVVHAVRQERLGENFFKLQLTSLAYKIIRKISSIELLENAGNFKLLSRRVVQELLRLKEQDPYLRGLISWVGFKQDKIYYKRQKRFAGKGHFPVLTSSGPIKEFISGVTSFSEFFPFLPIGSGLIFLILGLVAGFRELIIFLSGAMSPSWIITLILIVGGVQLISLGLVGLYIGRIWKEVARRPRHIVESTINVS